MPRADAANVNTDGALMFGEQLRQYCTEATGKERE